MEQTYTLTEIINAGFFAVLVCSVYIIMNNVAQMAYMIMGFWQPRLTTDEFPFWPKAAIAIINGCIMYFWGVEYLENWVFS